MTLQADAGTVGPRSLPRSAGAIFLGLVAVVILSLGTDQVMHVLDVYPPWDQPMPDTGDNLLALAYRSVYAVFGSNLAALLAPRNPMRHALILGAIGLVLGTVGAIATIPMNLRPAWYPISLAVTARHSAPRVVLLAAFALFPALSTAAAADLVAESRPRARALGIAPGIYPPGPLNAVTDVAGVRVGHTTVIEGDHVRTGVTAILPHAGNLFQEKVAGAVFVGNAFGKLAGSTQVAELGTIETPIVLTNTLSVGVAIDAVVRHTLGQPGNEEVRSVNALVGETNDGALNDIRGLHITGQHVLDAIARAGGGPVAEGSVGAGTGTTLYGWKGGIGTASRVLPGGHVVGVLAQTNFGGNLTIAGVPIFRTLQPRQRAAAAARGTGPAVASGDGSCLLVVATDAPLDARDLGRLGARAVFGLGRTGSSFSNGSGDYAIVFSTSPEMRSRAGETAPRMRRVLPTDALSPLFQAALEATEEAVYNSLFQATTVTSKFGTAEAIPIDRVRALLPQ